PVQLICGGATRASARRVAHTLAQQLPRVQLTLLDGAGHLAPIAEPDRVNPLLLAALQRHQTGG
ncbi:MAG: alpha/beta fold hydrolase, partial [Roseateles sp.]